MADESGPLEALGKILPSVYYDLIARVCAGVPFLAALLWTHKELVGELSWVKLMLLVGAGYVVGLLLTPLSLPWGLFQLLVRYILERPPEDWRVGSSICDAVTSKDKDAGATLVKMQAEAVLCQNLFGAFLALIILDATDLVSIPFLNACSTMCRTTVLLVLGLSCIHRTIACVVRENRLYEIYFPGKK